MPIQVTSKHAGSVTSASDNSDTLKIVEKCNIYKLTNKEFRNGDGVLEGIFQTLESNFSTRTDFLINQNDQPLQTSKY